MQDKAKIPMLKITVSIKKSSLEVSFPQPGQDPTPTSLENLDEAGKKIDLKPPATKNTQGVQTTTISSTVLQCSSMYIDCASNARCEEHSAVIYFRAWIQ